MEKLSKNLIRANAPEEPVRLNKYLSDAGFCSRREADKLIEEGRVFVDGIVAYLGQKVLPSQVVEADGKVLNRSEELILLAYNKPLGVECTTDPKNPDNIVDQIHYPMRIYPIGRLDKNSTGLILLTNTGEIVNQILKASNYHEKEYVVTVDQPITKEFLQNMRSGVTILLEDGTKKVKTRKCEVKQLDRQTFSIILTQGLNRQIRRMCQELGYKVTSLNRIRIMNILLDDLKIGTYRMLTEEEIKKLVSE
ncbi:MAG: pseudouridine synthase [Lachnospiraceae bacterium]|nr:pseudouridine synthase [Lachnospiraceae bacterium]